MARLIDITGKAVSGEWGTDDLDGSGIPVLRTTNFTNTGDVSYANVVTRSISKKNIANKFLRKGDIIIEKSGGSDKQPVGRVIYFEGEENKYLFNNFTGLLRVVNSQKWHSKYVFYSLYANYQKGGTRAFENKTTGLHNLKLDNYLNAVEIRNISYEIQEQRSVELDKLRKVINLRLAQLAKLDELVKCRFVELFGNIQNNRFNYPIYAVRELTQVWTGATPNRNNTSYYRGNIPWVKTGEIEQGYIFDTEEHITENAIKETNCKILPQYSVLIAMYGQGKTRGKAGILYIKAATNQACAAILPSLRLNPLFTYYYFLNQYEELRGLGHGAQQTNINLEIVKNYRIMVPPIEEQNTFADFVHRIDKLRFVIQQSLDETQKLFDSLMQEYFD